MAVHKLVLDDHDCGLYTLIAIHCAIEDYRLAYLLNKFLGLMLRRKKDDLDFKNGKLAYTIFEWEDNKQQTLWNLESNVCKIESFREAKSDSLFKMKEKIIQTNYLIPEHKTVNYFLKIDNHYNINKEKNILNSISNIPQVATAYSIEPNQLKSKDHLIFS